MINHGYLAVDFFFVFSGFVVGYAYDDRWNKMTIGAFFLRRLIRLQPMVVTLCFRGLTGFLIRTKYAFEKCSILLFIVLAMPRLGGKNHYWLNGLYEALCVIVVFPLIVALGAGGKLSGNLFSKGCDFMGKISYPLYIVHICLGHRYGLLLF